MVTWYGRFPMGTQSHFSRDDKWLDHEDNWHQWNGREWKRIETEEG